MPSLVVATGRAGSPTPSRAERWVLTLLLLHASGFTQAILDIATASPEGSELTNEISTMSWLACYLWAAVSLIYWYGTGWVRWLARYRTILFTVVVAVTLSFSWSIAPELTIQRSIHLVGTTIVAIYIGYRFETTALWSVLAFVLALSVLVGAVVSVALPHYGQMIYEGRQVWRGVQGHKNAFASVSSLCFFSFLVRSLHDRRHRWAGLALCGVSLLNIVMASSATTLISSILGAVSILFLRTFGGERGVMAGVALLLAGFAVLGMTIASMAAGLPAWDPATWTAFLERSADFSGRQEIWGPTWDAILRRPLLGYGYGAVWFPREGSEYVQQYLLRTYWTAYHGHNVFLHVGVELGLPAAVAMVGFVLWTVRESLALQFRYPSAFLLFVLSFEVAFVVTNIFEAGVLIDRALDWILFVALPLCALRSCQTLALEAGSPPAAGSTAAADVTE